MTFARTLRRAMLLHLRPDTVTLDEINETFDGRYLHPTKGFRKLPNLRRIFAIQYAAEVKAGLRPYVLLPMKGFKE